MRHVKQVKGGKSARIFATKERLFLCQSSALADVNTIDNYSEWMKGLLIPIPDGHYELKAFASDDERDVVLASAVFHGTHTGDGGPLPATGKSVAADYVYSIEFEGEKIRHITKVWNDEYYLKALGWA